MRCFALLALLLFTACSKEPTAVTSLEGNAMTMQFRILIGEPLLDLARTKQVIQETFAEVDQRYNKWNPESELSHLNRMRSGTKVNVSPELYQLLQITRDLVAMSDGKFDPTIEPLQRVWKAHLEKGMIPNQETLAPLRSSIGWNKIHLRDGKIEKESSETELDLGGIAKGYAVDLLIERLNRLGYSHLYVEWGGEIRALGSHPEGRPWRVFISKEGDPDPQNAVAILELRNQAVATSGDYFQNWTVDDCTYFHILDPVTLSPLTCGADRVKSASVVAPTCVEADALATVAMLFPSFHEARNWAERIEEENPSIQIFLSSAEEDRRYPISLPPILP